MKGTGAFWDSIGYRLYIIGGLGGIVFLAVAILLSFPGGPPQWVWLIFLSCFTLWFLGLLGYGWWQILFQGYGDITHLEVEVEDGPPLSMVGSKTKLWKAMAVYGGDAEELGRFERRSRRPLVEWFGWATALGLAPFALVWLGNLFPLSEGAIGYCIASIVGLAVLMLVRTFFLFNVQMDEFNVGFLAPLGLKPGLQIDIGDDRPRILPTGATVMAGERYGRPVYIEVDDTSRTYVEVPLPAFAIHSDKGKLHAAKGAPGFVAEGLRGLRKAKRWQDLEVSASQEGLLVHRAHVSGDAWLYDLWLAERLLAAFDQMK